MSTVSFDKRSSGEQWADALTPAISSLGRRIGGKGKDMGFLGGIGKALGGAAAPFKGIHKAVTGAGGLAHKAVVGSGKATLGAGKLAKKGLSSPIRSLSGRR